MSTRRWLTTLTTLTRRATSPLSQPQPQIQPLTKPITPPLLALPSHYLFTRHFNENVQNDAGGDPEAEAEAIGYKFVGPLEKTERVFKPFENVFAVVQVGSHQFKVSNGDTVYVERLKYCDVNDKLMLNKVLLLGSSMQTIVGRPTLPDAVVHAVVEEHALDEKVIIFKKKRRKNYRRTRGHRQELTRLRITDIQGIAKPESRDAGKPSKAVSKKPAESADAGKPSKAGSKKPEKVAVPA